MKKYALFLLVAAAAGLTALFVGRLAPSASTASSHREAPLISEDPTADNTDLYAFRSPDKPSTFTIVSNWIPGEDPAAGPNYYTFSTTARYNIYIDRNGDGRPDVTYTFRFKTPTGPYFLGNTQQSWTATRNGKAWAKGTTPIFSCESAGGKRQRSTSRATLSGPSAFSAGLCRVPSTSRL